MYKIQGLSQPDASVSKRVFVGVLTTDERKRRSLRSTIKGCSTVYTLKQVMLHLPTVLRNPTIAAQHRGSRQARMVGDAVTLHQNLFEVARLTGHCGNLPSISHVRCTGAPGACRQA